MKRLSLLDAMPDQIDPQAVVKTSNVLLHSAFRLTPPQMKLAYILASKVRISDTDFYEYTFRAEDLLDALGIKDRGQKAYRDLRKLTKSMVREVFEFIDGDDFVQTAWFSQAVYHRGGTVSLQFVPRLKKYYIGLIEAGNFTRQELEIVCALKGDYAIRFHGLFREKAFTKKANCWVVRISIAEIRKMFLLEDKYTGKDGNKDLRVKVVAPAVEEITEKTELNVTYKPYKNGRGIVGFDFSCSFKQAGERMAQDQVETDIETVRAKLKGLQLKKFNAELAVVENQEFLPVGPVGFSADTLKKAAIEDVVKKYL